MSPILTDNELVGLFFARSEAAIGETAKKYGPGCTKIARNILRDPLDAEESVSDTWLAAWNAIPPEHPDPLRAYLYRICRNLAVKKYHSRTAQKRDSSYDVALDELEGCLAAPGGVEESFSSQQLTQALDRFLAGLDRDHRFLFVRRYWYGDSVQDLAQRLGLRPNTVSARLARLRKRLRKQLEKEGFCL